MKCCLRIALALAGYGVLCSVSAPVAQAQKTQAVKLKSVVMCRKYNGDAVDITTTFKPTDLKIHCVTKLNRVATVTARSVWIAVDAGGVKNYKIVEASLPKQLVDQLHFHASLPNPWPVGKYRIDIYVNGKLLGSKAYTVAK